MDSRITPQLIIFDLYGTLVKFGVMHHPFRELLKWSRAQGRPTNPDDARQIMTTDADLPQLISRLRIAAPDEVLSNIEQQIEHELASLCLYEDVIPTLTQLQQLEIPIAICSNLAKPYGAVIDQLLPQFNFMRFLSYEVGYIKPEAQIYQQIVDDSGFSGASCLFVGDTFIADYEGPIKHGFQARHLVRGQKSEPYTISNLDNILQLIRI